MIRFFSKKKKSILYLLLLFFSIYAKATPKYLTCSDFIDTSYIEITKVNCEVGAQICLDIALGDFLSYSLTDNGQPYSGGVNVCDFDTSFAYTYFMLPGSGLSGPYMIDSWMVDGNIFSGQVADMSALADSMNVWDPSGNWVLDSPTSSIRGGITSINYGNMEVTQISSSISSTMNLTTSLNPNGSLISLETGYHELIFTEPSEGCMDTIIVVINCTPCPSIYSGSANILADDCFSNTAVCFDIPMNEISDYTIKNNGLVFTGIIQDCEMNGTFYYDYSGVPSQGTSGPYELQNWMVNGSAFNGIFGNITELVIAMNIWDPGANWTLDAGSLTINGGIGSNIYSDIQILQIMSGLSGTAIINPVPTQTSIEIQLPTGSHELIFSNTQNLCEDTVSLFIDCIPCPVIFGGMPILVEAVHCDSVTGFCLPVPFAEIDDYSFIINGSSYTGGFLQCSADSSMILLDTGFYHIVLANSLTGCQDSVEITVVCTPDTGCGDFLSDEIVFLSVNDCSDLADFCVEIPFSAINEFSIFDNDVLYENSIENCYSDTANASIGLAPGPHQVVFRHDLTNCSDTADVLVVCIPTETLALTVFVNAVDTICMDISELIGEVVSFENVCETASGEFVLFELDAENYCVSYTAIEAGTENACIVVCDDLGYCDTTFISITVEQMVNPLPDAVDDFVTTAMNSPLTIDVLSNDEINGILDTLYLQTFPENGTVDLNENGAITYTPNADFCNSATPDEFTYFICNENGCDQATVSITVFCEESKVYTGFSPNGDGKNDCFVIREAQNLPGNKLWIYNRWGLLVYQAESYQNDWKGTWKGNDLSDGTYFYLFDDGQGNQKSGYVQIHR